MSSGHEDGTSTLTRRRATGNATDERSGNAPGNTCSGSGSVSTHPLVSAKADAIGSNSDAKAGDSLAPREAVWSSGVPFYPASRKYWRIGGKWYDFEPFLAKHPGGSTVLLLARDRFEDCTFAFEAHHHNYQKVRAIIRKYEVTEDVVLAEGLLQRPKGSEAYLDKSMDNSGPKLLGDEAFYSVLRRRITEYLRSVGHPDGGPTLQCKALFWATFFGWAASGWLTFWTGYWVCALSFGFMATWLGAFGHNWVHQPKYRFWAYLSLDAIGFSSDAWFRDHLLQHHMYTNTPWDNHFKGTDPFLITDPTVERNWVQSKILPYMHPVLLSFGLYVNYLAHAVQLLLGREVYSVAKLVLPLQIVFLMARWGVFWGAVLHLTAMSVLGNYYFTIALMNHNAEHCMDVKSRNESQDWGVAQLHASADFGTHLSFLGASRFLWLNFHTVHHLVPLTDFSHHPAIQQILIDTCKEFGITYRCGKAVTLYREMVRSFSTPLALMQEVLVYAGGV